MKNYGIILSILFSILILGLGLQDVVAIEYNSPVIITQVELATPLKSGYTQQSVCTVMLNGTKICYPIKNPYDNPQSPYYNIDCISFNGANPCELIHEDEKITHVCNSLHGSTAGPQKIDIYNNLNYSVKLTHFELDNFINNTVYINGIPQYAKEFSEGGKDWNFTIGPNQMCTLSINPINSALEIPLRGSSLVISYVYDGKNYTDSTPFLTDTYNDSKTWQFDGNKWTFAEQNTVTIPEFPFAIPILLISITSLIVFYRIKFR